MKAPVPGRFCPSHSVTAVPKAPICVASFTWDEKSLVVLDGLINPLFISVFSFPPPLIFSPVFFSVAPAFPYVFPPPHLSLYPHPLQIFFNKRS